MAGRFADCRLIFSDASLKRHGGLAAVIFAWIQPVDATL